MRQYRNGGTPYRFEEQNESRADRAEAAVALVSDCAYREEAGGVYTDLSDTLACLRHLADRAGIDWEDVLSHANRAYDGDGEDGPYVVHDVGRFPGS